jgi:hypothetical protein
MRRNHFEFTANGHLLTAEQAWSRFVSGVNDHVPTGRTTAITHDQLMNNPGHVMESIMAWQEAGISSRTSGCPTEEAHQRLA